MTAAQGNFNASVYTNGSFNQPSSGLQFFQGCDFNDKVILDCGCGNGNATLEILKNFHPAKVYAFDASESQIAAAHKLESKVEFFVATFDNFLEVRPDLKGKIDVVISKFAIHFAPSLAHFFSLVATSLRPKGLFWAIWPVMKSFMGPVVNAAKNEEKFAAFLRDFVVDDLHPNGTYIPGKQNHHHLRLTFDALKSFDRQFVAKVMLYHPPHKSREDMSRFIAGINPARSLIPAQLTDEFDNFCATEVLKLDYWDGLSRRITAMQVRTQLLPSAL